MAVEDGKLCSPLNRPLSLFGGGWMETGKLASGLKGDLGVTGEAFNAILNHPALQHGADTDEQVGQIDGLGHEVICTGGHRLPKM